MNKRDELIELLKIQCGILHGELSINFYGKHEICFVINNYDSHDILTLVANINKLGEFRKYFEINTVFETYSGGSFGFEILNILNLFMNMTEEELGIEKDEE